MRRKDLIWFLALQVALFLGGCGGGGGGGSTAPKSQVVLHSMQMLSTGTIVPNRSVTLSVRVSSDADFRDLGISYYLLSRDAATGEVESSYAFGNATIPVVSSGDNLYTQSFLFSGDVPAGRYSLLAYLDPLETSLPSDAERVFPASDDVGPTVGNDPGLPDLVLRDLRPESSYMVISHDENVDDGTARDHLSGTADVESVAHGSTNVVVTAAVETSLGYENVLLWDSSLHAFADRLTIASLDANVVRSIMLDFFVPDAIRQRLAGRTATSLRIVVDPFDTIAEDESAATVSGRTWDNEFILPVRVYASSPKAKGDAGLSFQTSFSKGFDNKYFGADLSFLGKAWLNAQGIGASVSATVPMTILGHTFDFLGITSDAHYNPIMPTDSAYDLDVEFAGITLYSQSGNAGFSWSKTWQIQKSEGFSDTFIIAIVPVTVDAGASGALGFTASATIDSAFNGSVSPFVDVGAYASAAVNLVVAKGGIRGSLYLIGCTFNTTLGGSVSVDAAATQLTGTLNETVGYTLTGPHGGLELFVKWPKTCWKWHTIPYPCGWNEKDWSIVDWSGYSKSDTLLDKHQSTTIPLSH